MGWATTANPTDEREALLPVTPDDPQPPLSGDHQGHTPQGGTTATRPPEPGAGQSVTGQHYEMRSRAGSVTPQRRDIERPGAQV